MGSIFDELTDAARLRVVADTGYLHIPVESEGILVGSLSIIYTSGTFPVTEKQWRVLQTLFNPSNRSAVGTLASEVFDKKAWRAFSGARRLAVQGDSPEVEPRHLFFSLFREDQGLFRFAFSLNDASIKELRMALRSEMPRASLAMIKALPFSDSLKRVLDFARLEALRLQDESIKSNHLLTALLNERDAVILRLLKDQGINYEIILRRN